MRCAFLSDRRRNWAGPTAARGPGGVLLRRMGRPPQRDLRVCILCWVVRDPSNPWSFTFDAHLFIESTFSACWSHSIVSRGAPPRTRERASEDTGPRWTRRNPARRSTASPQNGFGCTQKNSPFPSPFDVGRRPRSMQLKPFPPRPPKPSMLPDLGRPPTSHPSKQSTSILIQ